MTLRRVKVGGGGGADGAPASRTGKKGEGWGGALSPDTNPSAGGGSGRSRWRGVLVDVRKRMVRREVGRREWFGSGGGW